MEKEAIYIAVGTLVISNIGLIGSVIWWGMKLVWFVAEIKHNIKANTKDLNNAHKKIRDLEARLNQ